MKKIKLLGLAIAALFTGTVMAQETENVVDYFQGTKTAGIINTDRTESTIKINTNTTSVSGYKLDGSITFANGVFTKYIEVSVADGGLLTGDKVTINHCYNNSATKETAIVVMSPDGTTLFTTGQSNNTKHVNDPSEDSFILDKDYTSIFLGRKGSTSTFVTGIKVARPVAAKDDATLRSIMLNGTLLEGFNAETTEYTIELPYGSTVADIPTATATATAKNANVVVNAATVLPGATTIVVTAEDGTTTKTYTINFTVATTASSEKELFNVTIDGKLITLTDGQGSLTVYKNTDVTAMTVAFELSDKATASFTSGSTHDFTNPLVITVTAQNGTTANYTLTVTKAEKTILYLTRNATEGDLMYAAIAAKGYYMEVRANGDNTDFSNYDLVVLHESLDGKAASSGELAALKTANVPVLNTKSWFYQSGRWDLGTATNGNDQEFITIPTGEYGNIAQHPIFKNIDLTNNTVTLYNNKVAKNIQPVATFTAGMEGYTLATVEGGTAIHELPAATRVGAEGTAKYLLISLFSNQFGDLTADAQTILSNACDYLMGTEAWIPQAPEVKSNKKDVLSFSLNGVEGTIDNENRTIAVNYYDFLGAVTALTANIKVSDYATISENMAAAQDYTNPVTFTVTAQDGTTAEYTVTVTVGTMPALAKASMNYTSVMDETWTTPEWMYLINTETDYNGTYSTTGGKSDAECTVNGGAYRLTQEGKIYMQLEACDSVKVITSATGSRTYQLEVVGGTLKASKSTKSNIKTTTTLVVDSDSPVLICLSTPEAGGGFTFSGVEVYYNPNKTPTAIDEAEAAEQAQKVMIGGQLMIIKNGVMYNAQGAIVK